MSYSPADLVVVGWNAAFVYDTSAGAHTTVSSSICQLAALEFRHYDEVLTPNERACINRGEGEQVSGPLAPGPSFGPTPYLSSMSPSHGARR